MEANVDGEKLVQKWIGPFEIMQKVNPKVYRLRLSNKYPGHPVINYEHLKKYEESPAEFGERTKLPETRQHVREQEEYEVERIIGHKRVRKGKTQQYLVRWANYGPQFDEWRTEKQLTNSPMLLAEYKRKHQL